MMYNYVGSEAPTYGRPAHVPERLWQQAVDSNPDPSRFVPVQATGFEDLKKRIDDQEKTTVEHQKALEVIYFTQLFSFFEGYAKVYYRFTT